MKLTILGTGNAKVTKCYNTCFTLNEGSEYFMIDGGGGSTILKQLEDAGISWKDISTIFVTHKHIDHLLGIIWMLRMYCQGMARLFTVYSAFPLFLFFFCQTKDTLHIFY